jgi:hypothetical protein
MFCVTSKTGRSRAWATKANQIKPKHKQILCRVPHQSLSLWQVRPLLQQKNLQGASPHAPAAGHALSSPAAQQQQLKQPHHQQHRPVHVRKPTVGGLWAESAVNRWCAEWLRGPMLLLQDTAAGHVAQLPPLPCWHLHEYVTAARYTLMAVAASYKVHVKEEH